MTVSISKTSDSNITSFIETSNEELRGAADEPAQVYCDRVIGSRWEYFKLC